MDEAKCQRIPILIYLFISSCCFIELLLPDKSVSVVSISSMSCQFLQLIIIFESSHSSCDSSLSRAFWSVTFPSVCLFCHSSRWNDKVQAKSSAQHLATVWYLLLTITICFIYFLTIKVKDVYFSESWRRTTPVAWLWTTNWYFLQNHYVVFCTHC